MLRIPTCWYLKMLKFVLPPIQTLKFVLPQTQMPDANRWNIGGVGSLGIGSRIGHVHFMLFVSLSLALGETSTFITAGCNHNAGAFNSYV